jgi:Fur family transcriptional regulator, ferric uptake regulator
MNQGSYSRITKQRQVILEALESSLSHPTADEIYDTVRRRLPRISLGTVYRNLEIMAAQGMIQKLHVAGRQLRFDYDPKVHHHIRCVECGTLADVSVKSPASLRDMVEDVNGYEISEVRLQLLGLCPKCKGSRVAPDS